MPGRGDNHILTVYHAHLRCVETGEGAQMIVTLSRVYTLMGYLLAACSGERPEWPKIKLSARISSALTESFLLLLTNQFDV